MYDSQYRTSERKCLVRTLDSKIKRERVEWGLSDQKLFGLIFGMTRRAWQRNLLRRTVERSLGERKET